MDGFNNWQNLSNVEVWFNYQLCFRLLYYL